jgi:glycerate kinase
VGEAIAAALERGAPHGAARIVVGLGGSATVDGGTGMARVFGSRFLDSSGAELPEGGGALVDLAAIEPGKPQDADVVALADVRSPLFGPDGAAHRFAAQKGATAEEVDLLEAGLERLAERIEHDLGLEVADLKGAGAAGGLGAGCVAFLGARLVPGAPWVLDRVGFDRALTASDLVITGEGAWDATSGLGKVTHEVIRRAREAGTPVLLACGRVDGAPGDSGLVVVDGGGDWLDREGLVHLVTTALREHLAGR